MARLSVYDTTTDFDISNYVNVTTRVEQGTEDFYTNTDIAGSTLYSFDGSVLYFGHAEQLATGDYGFVADGQISGRIGDQKLADWLAGRDLSQYTPETLVSRMFVGADKLRGGEGDDTLDGRAGTDSLHGRGGDDTLIGGVGSDTLIGGFGNDTSTGGFGADTFVYREPVDLIGGGDFITDFSHDDGDVIDLTGFDSLVRTEGQEVLTFLGETAFSATGVAEVRNEVVSDAINVLQFDINGDGTADVQLTVFTSTVLDATDVLTIAPPVASAFGADTALVAAAHAPQFLQAELANGVLA